ncbi:hypothetical protein [Streptomyces sp. NPDC101234]|uniref:hypothetical protein n=1 Tax=Streptomyces sp. NPDC101234 TaxID=3366138 RepID=UPI00380FEFDF
MSAFGSSGRAAGVPVGEVGQGLLAAFVEPVKEMVGDADGRVQIADLGLVVPEQGQPAVAADAVQAELDDLAGAPAGDDDGLPHVPQAPVVRVVAVGELLQVGFVGKCPGDFVGEGVAAAGRARAADRHGGDEGAVQADSLGAAAVQRAAQQGPAVVEHHPARVLGDRRPFAVQAGLAAEGQAEAFAVAQVRDEAVDVLAAQHGGVVAAARRLRLQERGQFGAGATHEVHRLGAARAGGRAQQVGDVIPQEVAQPLLGDAGQVDVAGAVREAHPEVLGLDVAGIPGVGGGEVDLPQGLLHLLDHALVVGAVEDGGVKAGQGRHVAALAFVRE